jgi:hypothetical protein
MANFEKKFGHLLMKPKFRVRKGFEGWQAGFIIGVQTFWLQEVETKASAQWYVKNLRTAFNNLQTTKTCRRCEKRKKKPKI